MKTFDIKDRSSEVLAIQVVGYRAFGSDREGAEAAMNELSLRREKGDLFDFEVFIDEKMKIIKQLEEVSSNQSNHLGLAFSMLNNFKVK